jgi:Flp pilus assembly protein protease CpaA
LLSALALTLLLRTALLEALVAVERLFLKRVDLNLISGRNGEGTSRVMSLAQSVPVHRDKCAF